MIACGHWLALMQGTWLSRWLMNFRRKPTWKLHHKFSARFRDEILGMAWFQVKQNLGMV
ncbi:unnamed protein product [Trifolium pratense]|uniref:Uncharacterized protein n=1 Tax=Trifolium pratense TaxID=57577 RepID=A0ACB0IRL8_TRIPR|nr:unnamed protein product [Trifolium pratense]